MVDDYNVLLEQLKEYVTSHTIEEMLYAGQKRFFNIKEEAAFEELSLKYDDETFNELGKPISYFRDNMADISQNFHEYEKVFNGIKEDKSKKVFIYMLAAKIYMDMTYIREAYDTEDIYFDLTVWNQLFDETYVDCGGYTGDTALSFICHCPSYKRMYVLEPLGESEAICRKNLSWFLKEGNTSVIKQAAYDGDAVLSFTRNNGTGDSCIDVGGDIQVSAGALDEIVKEPVSFIKMDIEGSEKAALAGAKKHIQNESPKMAICVYHLKDDFWKIPQMILDINPEYDFIFRQHRPDEYTETVLYAIPRISAKTEKSDLSTSAKFDRLKNALANIRIIPSEEFNNLMENIKDKAWYLYQIRMHNEEISRLTTYQKYLEDNLLNSQNRNKEAEQQLTDLNDWIHKLEEAKTYLENQLTNYMEESKRLAALLSEQKEWSEQLQKGKDYLEEHSIRQSDEIEQLQKTLTEQKLWSEQLQAGKDYLEEQLLSKDKEFENISNELKKQVQWNENLQDGKDYLENQLNGYQQENEKLNNYLEKQKQWSTELQIAKDYLETAFNKRDAEAETAKQDILKMEAQLTTLENELAKTKYRLSRLLNDSTIKKIIKIKKLEL